MATTLTFTSAPFAKLTQVTNTQPATTAYDILTVDATYNRRVYGIHVLLKDTTAQTLTVWLHNGTVAYDLYTAPLTGTATGVSLDLFGYINGDGIFNKQKDANGTPYFNLPSGWKIQLSHSVVFVSPEVMNIIVFGETYA